MKKNKIKVALSSEDVSKVESVNIKALGHESEPTDFTYSELIDINNQLSQEVVSLWHERFQNTMFKKSIWFKIFKFFNGDM